MAKSLSHHILSRYSYISPRVEVRSVIWSRVDIQSEFYYARLYICDSQLITQNKRPLSQPLLKHWYLELYIKCSCCFFCGFLSIVSSGAINFDGFCCSFFYPMYMYMYLFCVPKKELVVQKFDNFDCSCRWTF